MSGTIIKKSVWISWDLGLRGDYPGLYAWLDKNGAKECGNSSAVIQSARFRNKDIASIIEKELKENTKITQSDRIYIIYREDESEKIKGKFIFGNRKRSLWEGYAQTIGHGQEDIGE